MSPYGGNQMDADIFFNVVSLTLNKIFKNQLQFVFWPLNPSHENQFQKSKQQKLKHTNEKCGREDKKLN